MNDELALLCGIMQNPDSDLHRLAYADWLEELGTPADTARAEFIRLQINHGQALSENEFSANEAKLFVEYHIAWRHLIPPQLRPGVKYQRGFPSALRCDAADLLAAWQTNSMFVPLEILHIQVSSASISWLALARPNIMPPLRELEIINIIDFVGFGDLISQVLRRLAPLEYLDHLAIRDAGFSQASLELLAVSDSFPQLQSLDLSGCQLMDDLAEYLCVASWPRKLKRIKLNEHRFSPAVIQRLRDQYGPRLDL